LKELEFLHLVSNPISDISPLAGLRNLEELTLHYTATPEVQKAMLMIALPNDTINF
jgi:Leucine-rich repeat (LRR) protein